MLTKKTEIKKEEKTRMKTTLKTANVQNIEEELLKSSHYLKHLKQEKQLADTGL